MKVVQISIFLENKVGRLAEVTQTLADSKINIKSLALADTSEFGILRLIVDAPEKAHTALKAQNFTVGLADVVAVEVPHSSGGLNRIVTLMGKFAVNIEYMYGFPSQCANAVMIFRFDNIEKALELLQANNFVVLSSAQVYQ